MNDRELLEMAAKAFGFGAQNPPDNQHCWTQSEYPKRSGRHGALWNYVGHGETAELWNPLSDDGDALRLAVGLRLTINLTECQCCVGIYACQLDGEDEPDVSVRHSKEFDDCEVDDPYAATRRAIVRAAAEVGRNMK